MSTRPPGGKFNCANHGCLHIQMGSGVDCCISPTLAALQVVKLLCCKNNHIKLRQRKKWNLHSLLSLLLSETSQNSFWLQSRWCHCFPPYQHVCIYEILHLPKVQMEIVISPLNIRSKYHIRSVWGDVHCWILRVFFCQSSEVGCSVRDDIS